MSVFWDDQNTCCQMGVFWDDQNTPTAVVSARRNLKNYAVTCCHLKRTLNNFGRTSNGGLQTVAFVISLPSAKCTGHPSTLLKPSTTLPPLPSSVLVIPAHISFFQISSLDSRVQGINGATQIQGSRQPSCT